MSQGLLITFEGVDGTGKSTQIKLLAERLRADGYEVVETKEPGAARGGDRIRELLFKDPSTNNMAPGQGDCLFLYDHIGNVEEQIRPALKRGAVVICDRYADSQFAYASTKDTTKATLDAFRRLYGPEPAITVLFLVRGEEKDGVEDISWALRRALARRGAEAGKQEGKSWGQSVEQQRKIQQAYALQLFGQNRTLMFSIYENQGIQEIAEALYPLIKNKIHTMKFQQAQLVLPGTKNVAKETRQ